jgi:hypothetical protein
LSKTNRQFQVVHQPRFPQLNPNQPGKKEEETNLEETNVGGLLTEALTADVHLNQEPNQSPNPSIIKLNLEEEFHTPYLRIRPAR